MIADACSRDLANDSSQTILCVPYADKDVVKELGCKWDPTAKHWYVLSDNTQYTEITEKYLPIELKQSNYDDRLEIKALGACYNPNKKLWCIPKYRKELFKKWL